MQELVKVSLQNELDLILGHKRSMKLGELAGLSLSAQTTFATAVSEVARNTIENKGKGTLTLGVEVSRRDRFIVASLINEGNGSLKNWAGLEYAKKLVQKYHIDTSDNKTAIHLYFQWRLR
jgi:hypothetical protein